MAKRRIRQACWALGTAIVVTVSVSAQEKTEPRKSPRATTAEADVGVSDSKQERTREEKVQELLHRLGPALSHRHDDLRSYELSDGTRVTPLKGRFHHALLAHVDDAGHVRFRCVDSDEEARAFLLRDEVKE